jgi:hypothetical protein
MIVNQPQRGGLDRPVGARGIPVKEDGANQHYFTHQGRESELTPPSPLPGEPRGEGLPPLN